MTPSYTHTAVYIRQPSWHPYAGNDNLPMWDFWEAPEMVCFSVN